jgi:N-acetylglucosaminyl-diphospho-decaprenol L-rhamnosyltransferase
MIKTNYPGTTMINGLIERPCEYSLFRSNWYSKKYLKGDIYEGSPIDHFKKFGRISGLRCSVVIDDLIINEIYKKYATLTEYGSNSIAKLKSKNDLPLLIINLFPLLKKNKIEKIRLIDLYYIDSDAVLDGIFDEHTLKGRSLISVIEGIDLGELKLPNWFNVYSYLSLNPDAYNPSDQHVFMNYLEYGISEQRQLSRTDIYAPKDILELKELLQNRDGRIGDQSTLGFHVKSNSCNNYVKKHLIVSLIFFNNNVFELERSITSLVRAFEFQKMVGGLFLDATVFIHANSPIDEVDVRKLQRLAEKILIIGHGENIGYGKAHNSNFYRSLNIYGDDNYYLILNSDGELHPDSLINASCFIINNNDQNAVYEFEHFPIPHPKYLNPITRETTWFSGAAVLFHSKLFAVHKGFDEGMFLYCEDVELSIRIRWSGRKIYTLPNAYFSHDLSSRDRDDKLGRYKTMLTAKLRILKKFNDFENYIRVFKLIASLGPTSFDQAVNRNILFSSREKVTIVGKENYPDDFNFSNLHFSRSRKFITD